MKRPLLAAGPRLRSVAPLVDAVCLGVFVLLGRESHAVDGGPSWFLVVVWPFLTGWFLAALAMRLYTSSSRTRWRLATTVAVGVALGLMLRAVFTHRDTPVAFIVVALVFIAVSTCGWRIIVSGLWRASRRAA